MIGTLTTRDRNALVVRQNGTEGNFAWASTPGDLAAAVTHVDDCEFRMPELAETAAGLSLPADYRWQGTRRERQRLAGNGVNQPAARDLIGYVVEALTG